jgi:Tol biopolymer transport system component
MIREDWLAAERALVSLTAIDPTDPTNAEQLAALWREHGAIAFARDRALYTVGPDGADERLVTDAVPVIYPTWSPDRTRIAFVSADAEDTTGNVGLYVVNVDGSGLTRLADHVAYHTSPLWSPNGDFLAFTSFADYDVVHDQGVIAVHVVEVATGARR